jgi:hypothetical protein
LWVSYAGRRVKTLIEVNDGPQVMHEAIAGNFVVDPAF